jgi:hypothetical protein
MTYQALNNFRKWRLKYLDMKNVDQTYAISLRTLFRDSITENCPY